MIVSATDIKNNFGKFLRAAAKEDIIITSNGSKVARLSAYDAAEKINENRHVAENAEADKIRHWEAAYEEFLHLTETSDERYEYIDGEIYLLASPKTTHQQVLGELYYIFAGWLRGKKCRPLLAPYDIKLKRSQKEISVVQPDLMVICDLEENLSEDNYYTGVPTLVVEIMSESTRGKDAVRKLDLYMSTGVREYWLVNPMNREMTVYQFENYDISRSATFRHGEIVISYTFKELEVRIDDIILEKGS